ncbi:MAG TPA: hypothetical protein VG796_21710 [Verrucomicrobiales bacterium]|nr:hypothetical protein [Verrucomicrobiales bacterium]
MRHAFLVASLVSIACALHHAGAQTPAPPSPSGGPASSAAERPQTPAPPALAALRARYAESIVSADCAAISQWLPALAALEKTRATAEDYEGADAVRRRAEQALAVAGTDDGRIPIRLSSRDIAGKGSGLKVDDSAGIITISSGGAFLDWEVSGEIKGWYEARLTHAVAGRKDRTAEITPFTGPLTQERRNRKSGPDDSGAQSGWISFQNVSNLNRDELVLRREIVSTGGSHEWVTVPLGRLEIPGRLAKFRLVNDEAGSNPLRFRSLELVPVPAPATGEDGAARLAKAREVFNREFRIQTQASNNHYRDSLTQQELQARRANDTDTQVRLRDEKERLAKTPEQLALGEAGESGSRNTPIVMDVAPSSASFKFSYRGDITPDSTRTGLTKLRPANSASITWKLAACHVGSGVYSVEIKGRVPLNGGGTATLAATGPGGAAFGKPLNIEVKPVVSSSKPKKAESGSEAAPGPENRTLQAGSVAIGKGAESLTLTVTGLTHSDGWLMDLQQLTLTRTGDAPAAKTTP